MARKESTNRSPGTQRTPKGFTQGNILVDPITGDPICTSIDDDGRIRLCVDAEVNATIGDIDVNLDFPDDGVHIGDRHTGNELKIETDGSINVNSALDAAEDSIAVSAHPDQIFAAAASTISSTSFTQILSYTSLSDRTHIMTIECVAGVSSRFQVRVDGTPIRELRSSALNRNVVFDFKEHRNVLNTKIVTVYAAADTLDTNAPYDTFASVEGYLI